MFLNLNESQNIEFKQSWRDEYIKWLSAFGNTEGFATMMISEGEDILWVSKMLGHKSSDITLKTYAKAYSISHNKNERKQRALFLEKRHSLGTVDNLSPCEALN